MLYTAYLLPNERMNPSARFFFFFFHGKHRSPVLRSSLRVVCIGDERKAIESGTVVLSSAKMTVVCQAFSIGAGTSPPIPSPSIPTTLSVPSLPQISTSSPPVSAYMYNFDTSSSPDIFLQLQL